MPFCRAFFARAGGSTLRAIYSPNSDRTGPRPCGTCIRQVSNPHRKISLGRLTIRSIIDSMLPVDKCRTVELKRGSQRQVLHTNSTVVQKTAARNRFSDETYFNCIGPVSKAGIGARTMICDVSTGFATNLKDKSPISRLLRFSDVCD